MSTSGPATLPIVFKNATEPVPLNDKKQSGLLLVRFLVADKTQWSYDFAMYRHKSGVRGWFEPQGYHPLGYEPAQWALLPESVEPVPGQEKQAEQKENP
jgi:hypothetical protein